MCLNTYQKKPKKAHKDIKVYKVLEKMDCKDNVVKYKAPFFPNFLGNTDFYYYEPGKLHKPTRDGDEKKYWSIQPDITHPGVIRKVSEGWLHAYRREEDAKKHVYYNPPAGYDKKVIVKMIIPKGSEYYVNFNGSEIAADKLVWNK